MPIMNWDDSLDVGVSAMNDEHQEILAKMNEIYDAYKDGVSGARINRLVGQLGAITTSHFTDEEAFMESVAYPDLAKHKLIHKSLLQKFTGHAEKIEAAGGVVSDEFFDFLRSWLRAHIKGIDAKYGQHAQLKQAS